MSTLKNPVGPQPSKVYWRRRLIVGLGLLAVILVIILIVVRPGSATPVATNSPAASGAPAPASTNPADAVACDPAKVTVEAVTDATSYAPEINPMLNFALKSSMTSPCLLPAGSDVQHFIVTSGDEQIWSSRDCQKTPVAAEALLLPGVPKAGTPFAWARTRSAPDTCDAVLDQVTAGGASYHLTVAVSGIESAETKQFQLD